MRKLKFVSVLAVIALLAVLVAVNPGAASGDNGNGLDARLTGEKEVPGPGDPDGVGSAHVHIKEKKQLVCFRLEWKNLDPAIAAHIHVGGPDEAGPIVVTLFTAGETGLVTLSTKHTRLRACTQEFTPPEGVSVDELLEAIEENPENYYVNVHTTVYPAGAIRGQLTDDDDS